MNRGLNQLPQQENCPFELKGKETGRNEGRLSDFSEGAGRSILTWLQTCSIPQDQGIIMLKVTQQPGLPPWIQKWGEAEPGFDTPEELWPKRGGQYPCPAELLG